MTLRVPRVALSSQAMNDIENRSDLLHAPKAGDHIVQVWQDESSLNDSVCEYLLSGLQRGEGAIVISRLVRRVAVERGLALAGVDVDGAIAKGQLVFADAERSLARFMRNGNPDWTDFHAAIGGAIAEMRLQFPAVRAYGEMVDILWQQGARDAAIRLEEFWNELAKLQTFSLFCAYFMDNLDARNYGGPLECVCKVHTHLIPAQDYAGFNRAVQDASERVLEPRLANMLVSLSSADRPPVEMPPGQATLFWLQSNMPRTAEKILRELKDRSTA
jgi:hypothetical protein